jgi:hypothetical protein
MYVDILNSHRRGGCDRSLGLVAGRPLLQRDTCNGDSGGPFYVTGPDGGRLLAAATSRATDSAVSNCGDGGIYVRIDRYRSWIAGIPGAIFGIPIAAVVSAFALEFLHRTSGDRSVAGRAARRLEERDGKPVRIPREPAPGSAADIDEAGHGPAPAGAADPAVGAPATPATPAKPAGPAGPAPASDPAGGQVPGSDDDAADGLAAAPT